MRWLSWPGASGALALAALVGLMPAPAGAIVGGAATPKNQLRGLARIDLPDDVCTGTLIAPRLVLTALHCVQAPQGGVSPDEIGRRATVTIGNPNRRGRVQSRGVATVSVAPQVTPPPPIAGQVDVAILVLNRPATIAPLALASPPQAAGLTAAGSPLLLVGFGASVSPPPSPDGRLQVLEASTLLKDAALAAVTCPSADAEASPFISCAQPANRPGFAHLAGNSCAGDSGGPLVSSSANALAQVGVLSGGAGVDQCSQTNTTIYTPLTEPLAQWIAKVNATPLPPAVAAPRSCPQLRRSLRRARRKPARRATADRLAARVYRLC